MVIRVWAKRSGTYGKPRQTEHNDCKVGFLVCRILLVNLVSLRFRLNAHILRQKSDALALSPGCMQM